MDESSLGVHEIEFVIDSGEDFGNSGGVGDHAASSHDLGKITSWHDSWWLIVDTTYAKLKWRSANLDLKLEAHIKINIKYDL